MVIDHVGVVVRSLEQAMSTWQRAFRYLPATAAVVNERQKVRVVFLTKEGSLAVKLVQPLEPSSPAHAAAVRGGGLHHLCLRVDSVDAAVEELQKQGMHIIAPAQPGEAFGGAPIAFVYAGHGLNVELIDTDFRASPLTGQGSV